MPEPAICMTTEISVFKKSLVPGDVVLFDTLHPLSNLIKLAENRPVSHCALYLGDDTFAHVGRHKPGKTKRARPIVPAARTDDLTKWLTPPPGPYDRTVTALRHVAVNGASDAKAVVQRAKDYAIPGDTTYDYVSLVALMVPSLLRTYRSYFQKRRSMQNLEAALKAIASSLIDVFEQDAARDPVQARRSLTCSEFIYRCFDEGDPALRLEVLEPLARWPRPGNLKQPPVDGGGAAIARAAGGVGPVVSTKHVGGGRAEVVDGGELVTFSSSFRADLLGPPLVTATPATTPTPRRRIDVSAEIASGGGSSGPAEPRMDASAAGLPRDLAILAARTILNMIWGNRDLAKYDQDASRMRKGDVFADMVTPRDLWSSPSLRATAVLHRPPRPSDTDLDLAVNHEAVAAD